MHLALRKRILLGGSLATLLLAGVSLQGCNLVSDNLTGVSVQNAEFGSCVERCNRNANQELAQCLNEYQGTLAHCVRDLPPGPVRDACIRGAQQQHQGCVDLANQHRRECVNECHRQGGGGAS